MTDIVLAAIAVFGVVIVAGSGYRFITREDDRFERIALGSAPAAYSDETADATLIH